MSLESQRKKVEEILGTPLPELDPVYYEASEKWKDFDPNPFMTPYVMSKIYTPEEMKMVIALPGSAKDVAEKLGLDEEHCDKVLTSLFKRGRILPGKKYHLESVGTYAPTLNVVTLRDQIGMAYNAEGKDWNEEKEMFLLADAWCMPEGKEPSGVDLGEGTKALRIIPKYASIKNLPGVMPLENIKEVLYENFEKGTIAWQRCVCKSYRNFERYGKANFEDGSGCESGLKENDAKSGHCIAFGQRGLYLGQLFGYIPKDKAEIDKLLEEIEDAKVIYMAKNMPEVGNICTCCEDCCPTIYRGVKLGNNPYQASRFRPVVNVDKCIGCRVCASRCMFDAISFDENGKCVINEDKCMGCGNCVIKCPGKALKMQIVHDTDWIPQIEDYVR